MSGAPPVRVALIGCGFIAVERHLRAISAYPDGARVVALVDSDPARVAAARDACPAPGFPDVAALLRGGPPVDLAVVATPTAAHLPVLSQFAAAGVPVLCEKPLGPDTAAIEAAGLGTARIGVVHQLVKQRTVMAALAAVRAGMIGPVRLLRCRHLLAGPPEPGSWRLAPAGGGCLLDLGYHLVYLAEAVHGEPVRRVAARIEQPAGYAVDAGAMAWLDHAGGGASVIEVGWGMVSTELSVEIHGERGVIRLSYRQAEMGRYGGESWTPLTLADDTRGTFGRLYAEVVSQVRSGETPGVPFAAGLWVSRVLDACYQAARTELWTTVEAEYAGARRPGPPAVNLEVR